MFRKMRTIAAANLQVTMIYRMNFLMGIISTLIMFFVHYKLWETIYSVNGAEVIGEFTFKGMVIYIFTARVLYAMIHSFNLERKVSDEIKQGALSIYIVKPINYLFYNVSALLGKSILQLGVSLLIFVVFFCFAVYDASLFDDPLKLLLFGIAMLLGSLINLLIGYLFALTAFWIEQVDIMYVLKDMILNFISGVWVPLSFFPDTMQSILAYLPFKYLISFPIDIFLGHVRGSELYAGMAIQVLWVAALFLAGDWIWRRGLKKYTSVGG